MKMENGWRKRRGAWLLVSVCLLILLPQAAAQAKSSNQGKAGKNITWVYQPKTKTLTLSGKGYVSIDGLFGWDEEYDAKVWLGKEDAVLPMFRKIIFQEGITEIDNRFFYLENVQSISLPKSLQRISYCSVGDLNKVNGSYDPWSSTLQTIRVAKQNKKFKVSGSALVSGNGKTLYVVPSGKSRKKYTVPGKVTKIAKYAFWGTDIQEVVLGNQVTAIGERAFRRSTVKEVEFGKKVEKIGYGAFWGCDLTEVKFPDSLTVIGDNSFYGCPLTEIVIPAKVSRIKYLAFANNHKLQKIVIRGNTSVEEGAFFDVTRYKDGQGNVVHLPITVILGKNMKASVDNLCWELGIWVTFQVDSGNTRYYVKDKKLYLTRGNRLIYIYSEGQWDDVDTSYSC